jgi:hypothetical protein
VTAVGEAQPYPAAVGHRANPAAAARPPPGWVIGDRYPVGQRLPNP